MMQASRGRGTRDGLFLEAFHDAAIGMAIVAESGALLRANPALLSLSGRSTDELGGISAISLFHPDDVEPAHRDFVALRDGLTSTLHGEYRLVWPDGGVVWCDVHGAAIEDAEGIRGYFLQYVDVTERRISRDLLEGQAEVLRRIAGGQPLPLVLEGVCRLLSGSGRDTRLVASVLLLDGDRLRYGAALGLPRDYLDAVDGHRAAAGAGSCGTAAATGRPVVVTDVASDPLWDAFPELVALLADAGLHACWSMPIWSLDGGEVLGTFALYGSQRRGPTAAETELQRTAAHLAAIAIEQERAASRLREHAARLQAANEGLEAAARLKDEFLSMTSHELRTPLTPMIGFLETLDGRWETFPDDRRRELIGIVDRHARTMQRLVDDLLTMARASAHRLGPVTQVVPVASVVDEAVRGVGADAADVEVPADLVVMVDPQHLQQILVNFLTNAQKYAPGRRLDVRADRDGDHVRIRVVDDGPGVPDDFVDDLFEPFTQASHGDRRTARGTGLGLSVVRALAAANGGDAWYEPARTGGACFFVRLPAP